MSEFERISLLDNELVRKYFGNETTGGMIHCDDPKTFHYRDWIAGNVLRAMQEPIRKGERALFCDGNKIEEVIIGSNMPQTLLRSWFRLPDRFQREKCDHRERMCMHCGTEFPAKQSPAVEENKIKGSTTIDELVELVRKEWK